MTTYLAFWTGAPVVGATLRAKTIVDQLSCSAMFLPGTFHDDTWAAALAGRDLVDARAKHYLHWIDFVPVKSWSPEEIVQALIAQRPGDRCVHASVATPYVDRLYQAGLAESPDGQGRFPFLCHSCDLFLGGIHLFNAAQLEYFGQATLAVVFRGDGVIAEGGAEDARRRILAWPVVDELRRLVEEVVGPVHVSMWWELRQWGLGAHAPLQLVTRDYQWSLLAPDAFDDELIAIPTVFPETCAQRCDEMLVAYDRLAAGDARPVVVTNFVDAVTDFLICTQQMAAQDREEIAEVIRRRVTKNLAKGVLGS